MPSFLSDIHAPHRALLKRELHLYALYRFLSHRLAFARVPRADEDSIIFPMRIMNRPAKSQASARPYTVQSPLTERRPRNLYLHVQVANGTAYKIGHD